MLATALCIMLIVSSAIKFSNCVECELGEEYYSNIWAIELHDNLEAAEVRRIAHERSSVHNGQVLPDTNIHEFVHPKTDRCSHEPAYEHTEFLHSHPKIKLAKQQIISGTAVTTSHVPEPDIHLIDPLWNQTWNLNRGVGTTQYDMNVINVWRDGYTGKNVVVTMVDVGIQIDHPDLIRNYDPEASTDTIDNDSDPSPKYSGFINVPRNHGTRCAGEVGSVANNSHCSVGIAYDVKIGGIRYLDGYLVDTRIARTFSFNRDYIDIYSNSWGINDAGTWLEGPEQYAMQALKDGVEKGRGGKGSIFVFAAGNGGPTDDCSCSGYANSIYTISVTSASERNLPPYYLEECASTMTTAYSGGTTGIDKKITTTDVGSSCTSLHSGTSAATPQVSAIIALALEANPTLNWRDVQYITMASGNPEPLLGSGEFKVNAVGRKFSRKFGFGLLDAKVMVDMALSWRQVPPQIIYNSPLEQPYRLIQAHLPVSTNITIPACEAGWMGCIRYIEHIQLNLTVKASKRGAISVTIKSPSGTNSTLLRRRSRDYAIGAFTDWPFTSVHFWGENPAGNWTFEIDTSYYSGTLYSYTLILYGTAVDPFSHNYTHHNYTCHSTCSTRAGCFGPDPSDCIACNSSLLRNEVTKKCVEVCGVGFYIDTDSVSGRSTCRPCDSGCASCVGSGDTSCVTCMAGLYLDTWKSCVEQCAEGNYAESSNNTCQPCRYRCLSCTSPSDCLTCEDGYEPLNEECALGCKHGEYRNKQGVCKSCLVPSCSVCSSASTCSSCDSNYSKYHGDCVISCPVSTYSTTSNEGQRQCYDCSSKCETCNGPEDNNCLTCDQGYKVSVSHRCILNTSCPSGQFRHVSVGQCELCHPSCKECEGPSEVECRSCKNGYFLLYGSCVPACGVGYYNYTSPKDSHSACQLCDTSCVTCSGPAANQCTSCSTQITLIDGKCSTDCPDGKYPTHLSDKGKQCGTCSSACRTCNGPSFADCTSCPHDKVFTNDGFCVKDCPLGYFRGNRNQLADLSSSVCLSCHQLCKTCNGWTSEDCLSCYADRLYYDGLCVAPPTCYEHQYFNVTMQECQNCHITCGNCSGPGEAQCTSCHQDSGLYVLSHAGTDNMHVRGQCLASCSRIPTQTKCCSCGDLESGVHCAGMGCDKANAESATSSSRAQPEDVNTGLAVGIPIIILIPAILLIYIGWRYRAHGRCIWPRFCKKEGLSIHADDCANEMGSSNPGFE